MNSFTVGFFRRIGVALGVLASAAVLLPRAAAESAPPPVTTLLNHAEPAEGLIFVSPQGGGSSSSSSGQAIGIGPEITDSQGRPIWFSPMPQGQSALDFRVQTYRGRPVLTWSQSSGRYTTSPTVDYILDTSYHVVATVQAGNGLNADQHEFRLTPEGTALITIYHVLPMDLSALGGAADGFVTEGVVQEIDVASGRVLLEWHSLEDVALAESYAALPKTTSAASPYDYFHINSVSVDTDGNLLVSARHTWTVYKINRSTGQMMWRLGGKQSDFTLGAGLPFAWQHDAQAVGPNTLRIFDNESNGTPVLPSSRVLWVTLDETNMTAAIVKQFVHPDALSVAFMGNAEPLPNGDTFVGWGATGRYSEFDAAGQLVFDATLPGGYTTYRAYRFAWSGRPDGDPIATAEQDQDGGTVVHAIWNGATEVARWQVLGGVDAAHLSPIAATPWNGLDTTVAIGPALGCVRVVALDARGATLGSSAVVALPAPQNAVAVSPTPASASRLANVSIRASAGSGEQTLIVGFTVGGTTTNGPVPLLVRASGPSLVPFGVTGIAPDPALAIFNGASSIAENDDWSASTDAGALVTAADRDVGAFPLIPNSTDAAMVANLAPGNYTAEISDKGLGSGVVLAEIFDAASANRAHAVDLVAMSARARVGKDAAIMDAGFVIEGSSAKTLLIRAAGPALAGFGITDALASPRIEIHRAGANGDSVIAANAGWQGDPAIAAAGDSVGAFPLAPTSADSALVATLPPGAYTAEVSGTNGASGIALVEIYALR